MAENKEELSSLLITVKEESEKAGLKLNIQKLRSWHPIPSDLITWQIDGETLETVTDFIFWAPKSLQMVTAAMKLKNTYSLEEKKSYDQPRQHIKKQRHYLANKSPFSQNYDYSSSHLCMWDFDCEESWALKNWCFWTVVLEKTLESPLKSPRLQGDPTSPP